MEQGRSLIKSILLGAVTGACSAIALSLIAAALISAEQVPMEAVPLLSAIILTAGVFIGARTAARRQGGKTLVTCIAAAGCILGTALLMKAAFFQSWSERAIMGIVTAGSAAVAAALLPIGRRRGKARY